MLNIDFSKFKDSRDVTLPLQVCSDFLPKGSLECHQLMRLLPGKRLVFKAVYDGKTVLAKVFFGSGFKRRWLREVKGTKEIAGAKVNTPSLYASIEDKVQGFAVVLFEFIEQAETLETCYELEADIEKQLGYVKSAVNIIAKLHDAGVYQKDIHLSNFLMVADGLYLIDGDQVFSDLTKEGLAENKAIDNLAMFFTQLNPWEDELVETLFGYYLYSRKLMVSHISLAAVQKKLIQHRVWREKKYIEKKVFRTCSEFNVIKNRTNFCVFSRSIEEQEVQNFINNPDAYIDCGVILKSGRTATVAKIKFAGRYCVVKRYNKKSSLHRVARSLMESRSAVTWRNGHLLQFNGIPTAAPLLLFEQKCGPFRSGSYVITEYLEGEHLFDYFSRDDQSDDAIRMAKKVAELIHRFHRCGFSHGDLKPHNIWITNNEPILIDLDGMTKNKILKHHEQLKNDDWQRLSRDLGQSPIAEILFNGVQ